ncbi:MAG: hypothetical protein ACLQVL_29320 [Terriglobia bacterium]
MTKKNDISVERILAEFEKAERDPPHRNGTFKIEKPFDEALDTILKVKPQTKLGTRRKKQIA